MHFLCENHFGHFGKAWADFVSNHLEEIRNIYIEFGKIFRQYPQNVEPTQLKAVTIAAIAFQFFLICIGLKESFDDKAALADKKTIEKLIDSSAISTLLGKLLNENALCRSIILDIVTLLIKNTDDYHNTLFEEKEEEKQSYYYFREKKILIKSITSSIVELLFDERVELLIILIKILEYNEIDFSNEFNSEHIYQLFEYSIKNNKLMDMIKILFSILEINDNFIFHRINFILGYPTLIIKQSKTDDEKNEIKNTYEEKKENNEEEEINKEEKGNKIYWPLFGERLIMEENENKSETKNNLKLKLKKPIFKYIGIHHKKEIYCLLPILFPFEEDNENDDDDEKLIDEKERIKLIYNLLTLMLLGKGNYCVFKYVYLLPSRSIYYKNLYEEMIDTIEEENKINNNLYNLEDIKKNAEMCIKRIKYEVDKTIKDIKNNTIYLDDYQNNEEYKLPELMEKYYIKSDEIEKFIGTNPNMIQSDIIREEIRVLATGEGMYLVRCEYFTKYKTPDEIRNYLNNPKILDIKKDNKDEPKEEKEIEENLKENGEKITIEESETKNDKEEEKENKSENELDNLDDDNIYTIDISKINKDIDSREFIIDIKEILKREEVYKVVIEDPSCKNKKNVKSSLIRFIFVSHINSDNDLVIKILEKEITIEAKENYYYPKFFFDSIKMKNNSNFMNINRIRSDLSFLKTSNIGTNIDVKRA